MSEHFAQMGPMLILAGLMAGLVAETTSRTAGYGLIPDMIVGLFGSMVVGASLWAVIPSHGGMLGMLLIGCAGAALAIVAQRSWWRSGRSGA